MRISRQAGFSFAPKTLFWVALMLVFAQVAHAFDACSTHIEDTRQSKMSLSAPCSVGFNCELCAVVPVKDACDSVSELAIRASSGAYLSAPPIVIIDAPFVALPVPLLETPTLPPSYRGSSDVPRLHSLYLAPQLSGRAPPFSV